ncbi:MAG TPA: ABC transporter substrate-binding protein [Microbacterium sp.]|nr:ABC transporter substrate-binding protein [Microbacterium sp.]
MSSRRLIAAVAGATALILGLAGCAGVSAAGEGESSDVIRLGVPLPETGDNAQYGEYFMQGYELKLAEINDAGGIDGRQVELVYEDSQSDPAQAASLAQKFIDDSSIVATFADFGTPAAAASSPLYQQAGLLQFLFTQSASDVTDPGDYIFATWVSQEYEAPRLAEFALEHGDKAAVLYHDTDWGLNTYGFFDAGAADAGLDQVYTTAYDPQGKDYRPLLLAAAKADPEVLVIIGYAADGALITAQARELGLEQPIVGISSIYNQQFIELAGDAAEGVETLSYFTPENPDETVQKFIADFSEAYDVAVPSDFAIRAYDALSIVAGAIEDAAADGDITRESVRDALAAGSDFATILYGPVTFNEKRRVDDAEQFPLIVRDGAFVLRD